MLGPIQQYERENAAEALAGLLLFAGLLQTLVDAAQENNAGGDAAGQDTTHRFEELEDFDTSDEDLIMQVGQALRRE